MQRLIHIEGLRAYLAFWVVFDHILGSSGYSTATLSGIPRLIRQGWYAVDIFIIISGFVIFFLLGRKAQGYRPFIISRFFRLWPLFILLFSVSIPISLISLSNMNGFTELYPGSVVGNGQGLTKIQSWWDHVFVHIALHLPMLHGTIPTAIVPYAPSAFLGPAWSVSLEWQFYLIAPLVFSYLISGSKLAISIISTITLLIFILSRNLPDVQFGAFLPMHIEYFYLGGLSYFIFQWVSSRSYRIFFSPIGFIVGSVVFSLSSSKIDAIPVCFWGFFLTLLLDVQRNSVSFYINWIAWFFSNRVVLYLGKISYSIYLSHILVLAFCQLVILTYLQNISQMEHFFVLAIMTTLMTICVSHILFVFIESPGIKLGKKIVLMLRFKDFPKSEDEKNNESIIGK